MTDDYSETGFMLAAEQAINRLQVQADDAAAAAKVAANRAAASEESANRAEKSAKRWKKLTIVLTLFVVLTLALCGIGVNLWVNQRDTTNQLRQQIIASCQANNHQKADLDKALAAEIGVSSSITETAIAQLITVLEGKHPTSKVMALAKALENQIREQVHEVQVQYKQTLDKTNKPRNCASSFRNTIGNGADPTAGNPKADNMAVTWSVVQLKNWNGACLTVVNANRGTRVSQASCAHAHDWVYGTNGQLSPQGHMNVAVGDSGGRMVLKAPGTKSLANDVKRGPSGFTYDRMSFGVHGTYWHGNGAGKNVSLVAANSNADYWAFLGNINGNARTIA